MFGLLLKTVYLILVIFTGVFPGWFLSGCSLGVNDTSEWMINEAAIPLARSYSSFEIPVPTSPGILTKGNDRGVMIDYSNSHDGYITVLCRDSSQSRFRVLITGPGGNTYIYDLGEEGVLPLTEGDGLYKINVLRNKSDKEYSLVISISINVELNERFAPFIRPNQYVNYTADGRTAEKAAELTMESEHFFDVIETIITFIDNEISYDYDLAKVVESGYLPDVDAILERGKGICLDIAALTVAMLRSQGIPSKLVLGFNDDVYHAWVNIFVDEDGWVGNRVFFKGGEWNLIDPTLVTNVGIREAVRIIKDGSNYQAILHY